MNDSSNPGADFHCAPNSIIKLKGEDLPQPRNGAPTTSDAFVSQLRTDPYAANLVLAVPGIGTLRGTETVSNGNFSDGTTTGWTSNRSATITNNDGVMRVTNGASTTSGAHYPITTEIGKYYNLTFDVLTGANNGYIGVTDSNLYNSGTFVLAYAQYVNGSYSVVFKATSTTEILHFHVFGGSSGSFKEFDNISVREVNAPTDYSADIKGSGTNKTLTATGNAGVGYELGGYYGSAMTFDGTGDFLSIPNNSDFNYSGGEDFTIELWLYRKDTGGNDSIIGIFENTAGTRRTWQLEQRGNQAIRFEWWTDGSSGTDITTANNTVPIDQWSHICVERSGNVITVYVNGIAVGINVSAGSIYNNTTDPLRIGSQNAVPNAELNANIQDVRVYKGVAKYKGGFDVPKPYTPVGIEAFRTTVDTCKNNFCTWNPVYPGFSQNAVFTNGNLTVSEPTSNTAQGTGTIGPSSGKWYYEARAGSVTGASHMIGIRAAEWNNANSQNSLNYRSNGSVYNYSSAATSQATYTDGDVIGVAFDPTNGRLWFSKNGVWTDGAPSTGSGQNVNYTPSATTPFFAFDNVGGTQRWHTNFGQNPSFSGTTTAGTNTDSNGKGLFKYAPPSGFLALCEDNLPTPAIADPGEHFKTVLYTGSGGSKAITGVGLQPDFVWLKSRTNPSTGIYHTLVDSVRGAPHALFSNSTDVEDSPGGVSSPASVHGGISSFDNNGFSIMSGSSDDFLNNNGTPYVAWCWKAGGAAVSNTDGTLTSQVSVNQTAGFSIVKFTGQGGSSSATVGHGLGKKPAFWMYKPYTNTTNWYMYHQSLGASAWLNFTTSAATTSNPAAWGGVEPTSTVLTHGAGLVNQGSCILYAWTEIEGFSKFGSYVGNNSADGPFVYCGFKPAWVLIKKTNGSGNENWRLLDSSRCPGNQNNKQLLPSSSSSETTETGMDFLSNGFKLRDSDAHQNQDGSTYIFAAFAESPFQTANAK
jgi:hypothetical protein